MGLCAQALCAEIPVPEVDGHEEDEAPRGVKGVLHRHLEAIQGVCKSSIHVLLWVIYIVSGGFHERPISTFL